MQMCCKVTYSPEVIKPAAINELCAWFCCKIQISKTTMRAMAHLELEVKKRMDIFEQTLGTVKN